MISCLPSAFSTEADDHVTAPTADAGLAGGPPAAQVRWQEMEALAPGCREGDLLAWDALFTVAWPALVIFVHRLYHTFELQDAEDVAQATLEAAIQGVRSFTGKGSFRGWLFGIAAKQAASFHRLRSARKRGAGVIVALHDVSDPCDDGKSPADFSAASDRAEILHRALAKLEESDRDLVQLHFFGELTFQEIAAVRGMNPKTVCTRLTRSKEKLLAILGRFNLTHADG